MANEVVKHHNDFEHIFIMESLDSRRDANFFFAIIAKVRDEGYSIDEI